MTPGPWFTVKGDDDDALARARRALAGLEGVHVALDRSLGPTDTAAAVTAMLAALLDAAWPHYTARAARVRDHALALGQAFEVPPDFIPGLERAALLHDLGRLVLPAAPLPEPWRVATATRALIGLVPGLEDAATVIGSIWENWDGSGQPGHAAHGHIPLRSRLVRLALDWDDLPRVLPVEERIETVRAHAGTWYDPAVVAHFAALMRFEGAGQHRTRRLAVEELQPGQVLAQDLLTGSGTKLLSAGARLSASLIAVIERRHQNDPVIGGVWVENE